MSTVVLQLYKKKTEAAKKEYLKQLAAYRASLVSKVSTAPFYINIICVLPDVSRNVP